MLIYWKGKKNLEAHKLEAQRSYEFIQHSYHQAEESRSQHPDDPEQWIFVLVFDFEQKRVVPNLKIKQTLFKDQLYVSSEIIL